MSEQAKFREVDPLRIPKELYAIRCSDWHLRLNAPGSGCITMLDIDEARQLRDWLNKALPEATFTVVCTVPPDPDATP